MNMLKKGHAVKKDGLIVKTENYFDKRRAVMAVVYEARKFYANAPRTEIKICNEHERTLGTGWINNPIIAISEELSGDRLTYVVLHELVHTWFKMSGHNEECPLMASQVQEVVDIDKAWKAFKKYANKMK
jgi:Zn-dependent peptidase ImmA (M78 family)